MGFFSSEIIDNLEKMADVQEKSIEKVNVFFNCLFTAKNFEQYSKCVKQGVEDLK